MGVTCFTCTPASPAVDRVSGTSESKLLNLLRVHRTRVPSGPLADCNFYVGPDWRPALTGERLQTTDPEATEVFSLFMMPTA